MEDDRNRCNGARVHRIERVLSDNTTMGPRFSNRNAVLNPKSNLKVRSEPQSRAQRRIDELQRGPIAPLSAITGLPCHNRLSGMLQQAKKGPFVSQAHGPWSMVHAPWITGHDPTIQQPHGPIGHHSPTVLQPKCPSPILPHKLRHKPKPDLTHQPGLPGTKKSARRKKATRLGGFQVSMVSEAGFEPARPVCGH